MRPLEMEQAAAKERLDNANEAIRITELRQKEPQVIQKGENTALQLNLDRQTAAYAIRGRILANRLFLRPGGESHPLMSWPTLCCVCLYRGCDVLRHRCGRPFEHGSEKVAVDIPGVSCYAASQGQPSVWQNTFTNLAQTYPDLKFIIAKYNPHRTEANMMMKNLEGGRGPGTFFGEPSRSGSWGDAMFTWQAGAQVANSADFKEYDNMLSNLGL